MNIIQILDGGRLSPSYSNVIDFPSIEAQNSYWDKKKITKYEYKTPIQIYEEYPLPLSLNYSMDTAKNFNYLRIKVDNGKDEFGMTQYKWYYYFITKVDYNSPTSVLVHIQLDVWQTYMFDYEILDSFVVREHQDRYDRDGNAILNRKDEGLDLGTQLDISDPTYLGDDILWFHVISSKALGTLEAIHTDTPIQNLEVDKRVSVSGLYQPFFHYIIPFDRTNPDRVFYVYYNNNYRLLESGNIIAELLTTADSTISVRLLPYAPVNYRLDGDFLDLGDAVYAHKPSNKNIIIGDNTGEKSKDAKNDELGYIIYHNDSDKGAIFGPEWAEEGDKVQIYVRPRPGNKLETLTAETRKGVNIPIAADHTFEMPHVNIPDNYSVLIRATFSGSATGQYSINYDYKPSSEIDVLDISQSTILRSADQGEQVHIKIVPKNRYNIAPEFEDRTLGTFVNNEATFTMPASNVNIKVNPTLRDGDYDIIVNVSPENGATITNEDGGPVPTKARNGSIVRLKIQDAPHFTHTITTDGTANFLENPYGSIKWEMTHNNATINVNCLGDSRYTPTIDYDTNYLTIDSIPELYIGEEADITVMPRNPKVNSWEVESVSGGTAIKKDGKTLHVKLEAKVMNIKLKSGVYVNVYADYGAGAIPDPNVILPDQVFSGDSFNFSFQDKPGFSNDVQITGAQSYTHTGNYYTIVAGIEDIQIKLVATRAHKITYSYKSNEVSVVINTYNAQAGTPISFTAAPKYGFEIVSVTATGVGEVSHSGNTYNFTMPNSDTTVNINTTAIGPRSIVYKDSPDGRAVMVDKQGTVAFGEDFYAYIDLTDGYEITQFAAVDAKGNQLKTKYISKSGTVYKYKVYSSDAEGHTITVRPFTKKIPTPTIERTLTVKFASQTGNYDDCVISVNGVIMSNNGKVKYKAGDHVKFKVNSNYQDENDPKFIAQAILKGTDGTNLDDHIYGQPEYIDYDEHRVSLTITYTMPDQDTIYTATFNNNW